MIQISSLTPYHQERARLALLDAQLQEEQQQVERQIRLALWKLTEAKEQLAAMRQKEQKLKSHRRLQVVLRIGSFVIVMFTAQILTRHFSSYIKSVIG